MAFDDITPKKLVNAEIPTTIGTLYTVQANERVFVKDINLSNGNSSTVTVSLYLVDSGDSADDSNHLLKDVEILGNDAVQITGSQIIETGDTIQAISDTTKVSLKISGGVAV